MHTQFSARHFLEFVGVTIFFVFFFLDWRYYYSLSKRKNQQHSPVVFLRIMSILEKGKTHKPIKLKNKSSYYSFPLTLFGLGNQTGQKIGRCTPFKQTKGEREGFQNFEITFEKEPKEINAKG